MPHSKNVCHIVKGSTNTTLTVINEVEIKIENELLNISILYYN